MMDALKHSKFFLKPCSAPTWEAFLPKMSRWSNSIWKTSYRCLGVITLCFAGLCRNVVMSCRFTYISETDRGITPCIYLGRLLCLTFVIFWYTVTFNCVESDKTCIINISVKCKNKSKNARQSYQRRNRKFLAILTDYITSYLLEKKRSDEGQIFLGKHSWCT